MNYCTAGKSSLVDLLDLQPYGNNLKFHACDMVC